MSAVNNLTLLGIKDEDLNLLRNDRIKFNCGPLVYRSIIDWGFALPKDRQIKDHINDLDIVDKIKAKCNVDLNKWMKKNESKITRNSFSDFDITALHDFLPILCYEKIAQTGGQTYNAQINDPYSVESLLKEIKAFRNDVSHDYAEAIKGSHIEKTRDTMRECIRAAGKLYDKDQTEIDEKVKDLDDEFDKVLLDTTNLYENRVKYIGKFIETEVPAILLERHSSHFSIPQPGNRTKIHSSEISQSCNLSATTEDKVSSKSKDNKTVFPCTEIYKNTHNKFIVINGGPGSGKTTLMRSMWEDILETSVHGSTPKYDKMEQFKIPIYLECRNEQPTNLATFLRKCLKNFLSPEDDIYEAFKIVKCLVFLIDGYDEITNSCRKLVNSIIDFCKDYNATCIVSSRVDAGNSFINKLQKKKLSFSKMFIEPISEMSDKVSFLRSYSDIMDDSIETDKLVNSFENITEAAQEVFSSPILLTLFFSLFVHDPDSVSQMKNEQTAYEAVRTNFLRDMEEMLEDVPNPKGRAIDVSNVLSKFCLKFFRAKKYHLDNAEYLNMVAECEKIRGMPADVDIPNLLTCILTPEHSLKYTHSTSYQFLHSTIQEFFAAKYVSKNIRELQDDMSTQSQSVDRQLPQLLQVLGLDESQSDIEEEMKRYGNIIKFLMLETLANGELSKNRNTFTLMLKKYYRRGLSYFTNYHLDLILSSDSNADIISIVSDCMRGWGRYDLCNFRHIKSMTEVVQTLKTGVKIHFNSTDVVNSQQLIKLLAVLGDDSEIRLNLHHSHNHYQPLEGEFYTQLKKSKCKLTEFRACILSEEHLSIVVRAFRGNELIISTPSVIDISFAALEEYKGNLVLTVKTAEDCPSSVSNPVTGKTTVYIDDTPPDGKENLYSTIMYICPKSKEFLGISLEYCHLTDTDANELLKNLQGEVIKTRWGEKTEVEECPYALHQDKSRCLRLYLKDREVDIDEIMREMEREEERRKEERREEERREEERREEERREEERREEERREEERREEERRVKNWRDDIRKEKERRDEQIRRHEDDKDKTFRRFFNRFFKK